MQKTTKKPKRKNTSNKIGAKFEDRVQHKLDEYKKLGLCCMSKVPTEFKILRGAMGKIVSAFPVSESKFVDFTGVIKNVGHCDIETKTSANKTSFPLSNIKETQFEYFHYMYYEMNQRHLYFLIEFREQNEVYLVKAIDVENFKNTNTRKSIPYQWFKDNTILIEDLDFLPYIIQNNTY